MTQEQIKKLEELKSLLDSGILSQQEFNAEKAKIMSSQPAQAEPTRNDSSKTTTKKNPVVKWIIAALVIILAAIAMFFAFRTQPKAASVTENGKSISFISKDSRHEMTVHFGDSYDSIFEMSKADSENIERGCVFDPDKEFFGLAQKEYLGVVFDGVHMYFKNEKLSGIDFSLRLNNYNGDYNGQIRSMYEKLESQLEGMFPESRNEVSPDSVEYSGSGLKIQLTRELEAWDESAGLQLKIEK